MVQWKVDTYVLFMMLTRVGTNVLHWQPYNIVCYYYYCYYYDTVILYYIRRKYRLLADWFSLDELFSVENVTVSVKAIRIDGREKYIQAEGER